MKRQPTKPLCFLLLLSVFSSCDLIKELTGEELTPQQEITEKLKGQWGDVQDQNIPDNAFPALFDNLVLTFNADVDLNPGSFKAEGADDVFLTSNSSDWDWANGTTTTDIVLFDTEPITDITIEVDGSFLIIEFTYQGDESGRDKTIGDYMVKLRKLN